MTDVACPFDDCDLKAEADPKVRYLLFSSPFHCSDHSLGTAMSETTWYENTPRSDQRLLKWQAKVFTLPNTPLARHHGIARDRLPLLEARDRKSQPTKAG